MRMSHTGECLTKSLRRDFNPNISTNAPKIPLKLFRIAFFRHLYYYLTGTRIVSGLSTIATAPRACLGPRSPTSPNACFLLQLYLNLHLIP